jgi:hypothetical protein
MLQGSEHGGFRTYESDGGECEEKPLLRGETVSGKERAKSRSCFLHICLLRVFPSDTSKDP